MRPALKVTALVSVLMVVIIAVTLAALMTWLVQTERGSRWLLEQGLGLAPLTIEVSGASGTLADGLGVESLYIALPGAEIRAARIKARWRVSGLLAGVVDVENACIGELSVDVLEADGSGEPSDDALFWLQIPIDIRIETGQLDKLRVEQAEFEDMHVSGSIGHGRLDIVSLTALISGVRLQAGGELVGPAPGRLHAEVSWDGPEAKLSGSGRFSGNIEQLGFEHVANVPDPVHFAGTIHDLFIEPRLVGVADWPSVRLPLDTTVLSKAGEFSVASDFRSVQLEGETIVVLEGWPQAPVQLQADIGMQSIRIDSYTVDTLNGRIAGSGRIDYRDGMRGQLAITGEQIDTGLLNSDLPGHLGFDAALLIESAEEFAIDVGAADASIAGTRLTGTGYVGWRGGELSLVRADINAGNNRLSADVELGRQIAGMIKVDAPDLAALRPGLHGVMDATITLSGSRKHPGVDLVLKAASVSYGSESLQALTLSAELDQDRALVADLTATGLVAAERELGNLTFSLAGTVEDHRSRLDLSGGVVAVQLHARGGWDGEYMTQRFEYGRITPDGFDSWRLAQSPELRVSATAGQISAHCWQQHQADICIEASSWDKHSLQTAVAVDTFELATLAPLLPDGYSIDGTASVSLELLHDPAGLQAELHWRQSRTLLAYFDDIDRFQTVFDEVLIDLVSDPTRTSLDANIRSEEGLELTATARVTGPLVAESPLLASARGRLPSIELLRPLVDRVVSAGELKGELLMDLDATGTVGNPLFTGGAYLFDGSLGLLDAGVTLSGINITAQSEGTDKLQVTGELRSGDGAATVVGELRATDEPGLVADVRVQGENLATIRLPNLSVDTSPDLVARIGADIFDVSGTLTIPHATAQIRELPESAVRASADVVVHSAERAAEQASGTIVTGNVEVVLGDDVRFRGFGLDSRLEGRLKLTQNRGGFIRSGGTVRVRDGFLTGYGRELRVDRGELTFTGPLDDPLINIQVSRESIYEGRQYTIGLRLTGSAQNVVTEPFSRPAMSERDVLSFLLLDRPATSDSDASGAALALGLQQLVPGQNGILGLDEVSFETNDANEAAMVAGKRINDRLLVRYVFGSQGDPGSFRIRYQLGRGFSLEASTGSRQSLDLIYMLER